MAGLNATSLGVDISTNVSSFCKWATWKMRTLHQKEMSSHFCEIFRLMESCRTSNFFLGLVSINILSRVIVLNLWTDSVFANLSAYLLFCHPPRKRNGVLFSERSFVSLLSCMVCVSLWAPSIFYLMVFWKSAKSLHILARNFVSISLHFALFYEHILD